MKTDNEIVNNDESDLYSKLLELIGAYGTEAILEALCMHAEFESEDEDEVSARDRLIAGRLQLELDQLQERMLHFEEALNNILPQAVIKEDGSATNNDGNT